MSFEGIAGRALLQRMGVRRVRKYLAASNDNVDGAAEFARVPREETALTLALTGAHRRTPNTTAAYADKAMTSAES